jgi:uncharacterized protein (DUF427 family)
VEPGPGQESVWDYPRPPRIERSARTAKVLFADVVVARSSRALRVLETAGPPTVYLPPGDVASAHLLPSRHKTYCEWKGTASYFHVACGDRVARRAAWTYRRPKRGFEAITEFVSFYPGRVDACYLDDELVRPHPGRYYGGWVTNDIVGPVKGEPGSRDW